MLAELKLDSPLVLYLKEHKRAVVLGELEREIEGRKEVPENLIAIRTKMDQLEAALCLPLFFENELIGIFNLGEKKSQDIYTDEDLDLLTTLANQLAIAIRNAQLHEENLLAQKQLLQADKLSSLGRIAAGLAHEIKNPLAAIKGMTQAIDRNPNDQETLSDFKDVIPKEIDRLNNLIGNLLRLGKTPKLQFVSTDINQLINNTLKLFDNRCHNRKIEIIKKLIPLPQIKADPELLTQVLTNLILNAIQAMPHGGSLRIITQSNNNKVVIEIADTGNGIAEDKIANIFEPFFSTKDEGTGLGLAISYKIIKDLQGEIEVTSQVSQGTRFKITL